MSESPAYVSPFVRATRDSGRPLRTSPVGRDEVDGDLDDEIPVDHDAELEADADPDVHAGVPARVREGLPPSYRMRAEPHYVEALVDRSRSTFEAEAAAAPVARPLESAVTPPLSTALPPLEPADPAVTTSLMAAAAALAEAFEAIQAALRDVPLRGRPLRDRVAIELARAEATRGRWLADAALVLQVEPLPALDEVDLLRALAGVFEAWGPENRLSGGADAMRVPAGTCAVFGDERLLTTALGAILAAIRALIEDRGDARKVSVALGPRRDAATRTIEISQTAVRLPAAAYGRAFDADWHDHPAGPSGALLLAAAKKIALAHGGTLGVLPLEGGGCRFVLGLPAAD